MIQQQMAQKVICIIIYRNRKLRSCVNIAVAAPSKPSEKTLQEIINLLKNHFITAPTYHRALSYFLTRKKVTNEKVKNFYAELKKLAQQCDFGADYN